MADTLHDATQDLIRQTADNIGTILDRMQHECTACRTSEHACATHREMYGKLFAAWVTLMNARTLREMTVKPTPCANCRQPTTNPNFTCDDCQKAGTK